jgi:hypothetical protein
MAMALLRLFNHNAVPHLKKTTSTDKWAQRVREAMAYTPDAIDLEQSPYQNLFVCDDLMIGFADHGVLKGAQYQSTGFTKHHFSFFKRNSGLPPFGIPLQAWEHGKFYNHALQGGGYNDVRIPGKTYAPIRGEIYAVPSTLFANSLDKFKENGNMFIRRRIPIVVRGFQEWHTREGIIREPFQKQVTCWMYIAIPDFWNNLIDGGYNYCKVKDYEADRFDEGYGKFVMRRYYWYNEF